MLRLCARGIRGRGGVTALPLSLRGVALYGPQPPAPPGISQSRRELSSAGPWGSGGKKPPVKTTESRIKAVVGAVKSVSRSTLDFFLHPTLIPRKLNYVWGKIKDEAYHYWIGSKLLWADIKVAKNIMKRVLRGTELSRRERRQLVRTVQDVLRIVPLSIFVVVPFMELLLPFALKLFPNMLPSTFQDALKKEEAMKKELAMRLAVADFMQETLHSIASQKKKHGGMNSADKAGAKEVIEFFDKAKVGEPLSNENVIQMARLFEDELTLENVSRAQLVGMCRFMRLNPYGADSFLRFQVRPPSPFPSLPADPALVLVLVPPVAVAVAAMYIFLVLPLTSSPYL
jgi:hypothetical protein